MLRPGQTIANKLRVVRRLGEGGMGVVYEAVQLHLSRRVAVKVIHQHDATSPEARTRFRREAKAQASLPLEHIVQVIDFDTLPDGSLYTVMEFLDGRDLKRELKKRGPLPIAEACAYVAQACRGAAAAHAAGIVHRDLKPRNIFITNLDGERRIKLLDFGVAKFLEASGPDLTSTSVVLGTPTHIAPEQVDRAGDVDGRADIWALGIVLFELLTGRTPFRRDSTLATLAALATEPPPPLATLRPEISPELVQIVERCLAKQRDARFATADALADALLPHALGFAGSVRASQRVRRGSSAPPPEQGAPPDSSRLRQSVPTVAMPGAAMQIRVEPLPDVLRIISRPPDPLASGVEHDLPATMNGTASDAPPPTTSRWALALGVLVVLLASGLTFALTQGAPTPTSSPSVGARHQASPSASGNSSPPPPDSSSPPSPAPPLRQRGEGAASTGGERCCEPGCARTAQFAPPRGTSGASSTRSNHDSQHASGEPHAWVRRLGPVAPVTPKPLKGPKVFAFRAATARAERIRRAGAARAARDFGVGMIPAAVRIFVCTEAIDMRQGSLARCRARRRPPSWPPRAAPSALDVGAKNPT